MDREGKKREEKVSGDGENRGVVVQRQGRTGASTSTPVDARGALGLLGWQADRSARRAARRVVRPLPWTCHAPRGASRRGKSRRGTQAGMKQANGKGRASPVAEGESRGMEIRVLEVLGSLCPFQAFPLLSISTAFYL